MVNETLELMANQTTMQQTISMLQFQGFETKIQNCGDGCVEWKVLTVTKKNGSRNKLVFNKTGTVMEKSL